MCTMEFFHLYDKTCMDNKKKSYLFLTGSPYLRFCLIKKKIIALFVITFCKAVDSKDFSCDPSFYKRFSVRWDISLNSGFVSSQSAMEVWK